MTRKPSAPAHGITQSNNRMGSAIRRAPKILVQRELLLEQRMRVTQCVVALRDA